MNHSIRLPASIALALALIAPGARGEEPTRVAVSAVVKAPLSQSLALSGSLRSPRLSALSAQVDGYVTGVPVQAGDHVEPGQVVVTLDAALPQLELQRLEAATREAQSLLADQQRRVREAANLMNQDSFSRSEYESLQAEAEARKARLAQIRAQAAMQLTRVERHTVRAPFAGVVIEKHVEVGQRISGTTPLLRIASMDPIWAEVQLPERYLGRVSVGSPMKMLPPTQTGRWIDSRVSRVVPVSTQGARTFLVRGELANSNWALAPGMSVKVELGLSGEGVDVLQVPLDAVVRRPGGNALVWLVRGSGPATVEPRPVNLGRRSGSMVEVLNSEVSPGDRVVIRGNENLQAGEAVTLHGEHVAR